MIAIDKISSFFFTISMVLDMKLSKKLCVCVRVYGRMFSPFYTQENALFCQFLKVFHKIFQ